MNITKLLPIFVLVFSSFSFANSKHINKTDLYGRWQCEHDFNDPQKNWKINFHYTIHIMKGGTSVGNGTFLFSMLGLPELKYKENDKAFWSLKGDQLQFVANNIQVINANNPELEQLFNLQQLFPESINESVKVLSLSKKHIKIQSGRDHKTYYCFKI